MLSIQEPKHGLAVSRRTLGEPVDCLCQLGEFLLISVGESSDSGRGIPLAMMDGPLVGVVVLLIRKGCT